MPLSLNSTVTNTSRVTSRAALPQNHICSVSILRQKSNSETVNRLHNNNYPAQKQSQLHRLQDYSLIVIVCVCVCVKMLIINSCMTLCCRRCLYSTTFYFCKAQQRTGVWNLLQTLYTGHQLHRPQLQCPLVNKL